MTKSEAKNKSLSAQPDGRLTRRGWLLILVAVAAFHFVLGLMVGRGTAPVRFDIRALERELAALREAELHAEIKRFRVAMQGGDRQPLEFYRALKEENAAPRKVKAPPSSAPAKGAAARQASARPAPRPADTAGGKTGVQVASVQKAEAARRMIRSLEKQGFAAQIVKVEIAGRGTWYRVRVGPFADRQAAVKARDRLAGLRYKPMLIETE